MFRCSVGGETCANRFVIVSMVFSVAGTMLASFHFVEFVVVDTFELKVFPETNEWFNFIELDILNLFEFFKTIIYIIQNCRVDTS